MRTRTNAVPCDFVYLFINMFVRSFVICFIEHADTKDGDSHCALLIKSDYIRSSLYASHYNLSS